MSFYFLVVVFTSFCLSIGSTLISSTKLYAQQSVPVLMDGEYQIAGLRVEGIEHADKNAIMLLSGLQIGGKVTIPGPELGEAIKKLWKQNLFSNVEIKLDRQVDDKLFLVINLEERARISKTSFTGVTKGQTDDLRERVQFIRGQRFTESKKRTASKTIKNYFHEKGYLNCEVDIKARPDETTTNGVVVVCEINKGKKVKIRNIILNGVVETSHSALKRQLRETKQMKFYRVWKRSKYIPGKFSEDKKHLVEYMNSKGRRDAKLISDTIIKVDSKKIDLVVNMYEGKKYYFRNISWVGNVKHSTDELQRRLSIKKGTVYNPGLLERRLTIDPAGTDVSSLYLDNGYLFFRAEPVETTIEGDSIDLEIQVYEGERAKYDRIILEGNTITSDHVVLRQVRTIPGQWFNRSEIMRTQREILNLGYFNQENLQIIPIPNPEKGTVDVKYIVEERPNNQFFLQGGWGGQVRDATNRVISNGLILTVGLKFNNFATSKLFKRKAWRPLPSGNGQQLSLQVQLNGQSFQNYGISFVEPWLGGKKPISLGVNLGYSMQSSLFIPGFHINTIRTSVDLGQMIKWPDDFFRSFTTLNFSHYDISNAANYFSGLDNGGFTTISFRQTFDRTSIDVPIFPTSGSILNFSLEVTPPWSAFSSKDYSKLENNEKFKLLEFHKWKFRVETYTRLTKFKQPLVLFARMLGGYLGAYNPQIGVTPIERFYLGGDGLNGFSLDGREIIALRGYSNSSVGGNFGRTIYNKFTFELRQAISTSPSATVWVHGFAEAGYSWGSFSEYNPFKLARSAGGGVRIFLPMFGLLGVDYGYGFDPQPNANNKGQFHFMIGQQF